MERDSMIFYASFYQAMKMLPPEDFKECACGIFDYSFGLEEPEFESTMAEIIFTMAKPQIDANIERKENGKKGGRPKKETEKTIGFENENHRLENQKPNVNVNVNVNGNYKKENIKVKDTEYQYKEVIDYLNQKAGTKFKDKSKDTRSHIAARFKEGFTLQDFYKVIDNKVAEWKGTEMATYLRPSTLFGTKFEGYLNQQPKKQQKGFSNFEGRSMSDDLMRRLIV